MERRDDLNRAVCAFILNHTKTPIRASKLERLAIKRGFAIGRFKRIRAELAEHDKIELYREPYHWVWKRVTKRSANRG